MSITSDCLREFNNISLFIYLFIQTIVESVMNANALAGLVTGEKRANLAQKKKKKEIYKLQV